MRWRWIATWVLCAVLVCGLSVVGLRGDHEQASTVASVLGTAFGLFAVLSMWAWRGRGRRGQSTGDQITEAGEALARAVRRQWENEAVLRQLFDPAPLPVVWADSDLAGVSDHRRLVGVAVVCRADAAVELADAYRGLTRRRLVLLGPGGSGKTTFAVLLMLALLRTRTAGDPVPVLCSLSSFDPARHSAWDWLRCRITADYPLLADAERYGATAVEELLCEHRLIPVLDGLDELPAPGRAAVLRALNDTLPSHAPLVLTCRTDDYVRAVSESGVLTGAAVLEPAPVAFDDALALLRLATPPGPRHHGWEAVARHVARRPEAPAALALASPLMVALARSVYADADNDPAELADTVRFPTASAIERHLLDALVPTLYARARRQRPGGGWDPERAVRYLVRIAAGMRAEGTHDLAWWRMHRWTPALAGTWRRALSWTLIAAVGVIVTTALWVAPAGIVPWAGASDLSQYLRPALEAVAILPTVAVGGLLATLGRGGARAAVVAVSGVLTALPAAFVFSADFRHPAVLTAAAVFFGFSLWIVLLGTGMPTPPSIPSRGRPSLRQWRRRLARALAVVAGVTMGSQGAYICYAVIGDLRVSVPGVVPRGLLVGGGLGVGLAVLDWLRVPSAPDEPATPVSSLRADRLISLVSGIACTFVFVLPDAALKAAVWFPSRPLAGSLLLVAEGLFTGGFIGTVIALAAHAWPHYTLARLLLALRGELPWRLQAFLAEAHRLGILRRVGPVYQFRHARLRNRLAAGPQTRPAPRTTRTTRRASPRRSGSASG
ncbi:NACHT domain-containing protein [Streptomyces huiliensis]|uniref:NACHT domain-containing protein n=1 Tax=Streptomyces huiliensis TaxID=2876027 RepID=UPI001CBE3D9C|nr:NACHT domain-containing protein [Streptomyces huiliensis]MBZ4320102.1 NACHT domain-containing protein [Streptomyces huiliensis]